MATEGYTALDPTPPPASTQQARGSWRDWVQKPENRAALIQFGISALQPIAPGQSLGGHIGQAVGAGAEARDRNIVGRQEQEAEQRRAALDERALSVDEQQLEINRANAATNAANAGGGTLSKARFVDGMIQFLLGQDAFTLGSNPDLKPLVDALYNGTPDSQAALMQWFDELYSYVAAGGDPTTATGPARPPPPVGTVENGYQFQGGDPSDPANWFPVRQ